MTPLFDLYIACCTDDGGIAHVVLCDDGTLTKADFAPAPSPLWLVRENRRLHTLLFDPSKTGESGYTAFALGDDGALGQAEKPVSTGGAEACHLSVVGEAVYIANYQSGSVAKLTPDGRFVRRHESDGVTPHTHYIAPSPDGKFLLCTDLGTDTVFTYDFDLNPLYAAKTPTGSGPRHLAYSPDGKFVYCVNECGNTVTVFSYENGRLAPLQTVNALPFDHGESYAAAVRLRDGRLYVSHRGADCITVFSADGAQLTFEETVSCGGNWPRDFDLFGEFLVCTNEKSDSVTVLRKRADEWALCSTLSLPRPLCVAGKEWSRGI